MKRIENGGEPGRGRFHRFERMTRQHEINGRSGPGALEGERAGRHGSGLDDPLGLSSSLSRAYRRQQEGNMGSRTEPDV